MSMFRPGLGQQVAAGLAAASVALTSPVVAQQAAGEVRVSFGERPDLTRLMFDWPGGATVTPVVTGDGLDLRFSKAADPDIAELRVSPPRFLRSVEKTSAAGAPLVLRLRLEPGVRHRHFVEGGRIVVDLMEPLASAQPAPTPPDAPTEQDPAPRNGVVPVRLEETETETRITLKWARPARAAAFRRGEGVFLLFDSNAKLDLSGVRLGGARHSDIQTITGARVVGLRIASRSDVQVSAQMEGAVWTFVLSEAGAEQAYAPARREDSQPGLSRLVVDFNRQGVVRWIEDPEIQDRFAAALIEGPALGLAQRRVTLEAALLPAAHGAVVEARADGVGASFEDGDLVVSRGVGLLTSAEAPALVHDAQTVPPPPPAERFHETTHALELQAAMRPAGKHGGRAQMALARHLLAFELAPESVGVLRAAAAEAPELEADPQFRLLRGAANAMMGRVNEAQADLSLGALDDNAAAVLWRGYLAARQEAWIEARRELEQGRAALEDFPRPWRARLGLALAESALHLNDVAAAEQALNALAADAEGTPLAEQAGVMRARLAAARGETDAALAGFDALTRARDPEAAVRAELEALKLRRALGVLPEDAVERLSSLRFRWRGDGLEIEVLKTLGHVHADRGEWREALAVMHAGAARYPGMPVGRRIRQDLEGMFERLFLDGEADTLPPIRALALFYEFKDLTPVGAEGDRMIRRLSARLASFDLLEQATELLQHQVENRLRGPARAQVALDLAALYLSDGKPDKALTTIDSTRAPGLPSEIVSARRTLEAKALIELGRIDHAEELIERDKGEEASRLRAEIAWRRRDWRQVEAALRPLAPPPPRGEAPLRPEDRQLILRLAVAGVFAENEAGLAALRRDYAGAMAASADAEAFDVLTLKPSVADLRVRDVARQVGRTDLLERFLASVRERAAAAPERPA